MPKFRAIATSQVFVGNFEIPYTLSMGLHEFRFNRRIFRIKLPQIEVDEDYRVIDELKRYVEMSSCSPSVGIDSAWFNIHRVFIETDVVESVDAPDSVFDVPANAFHLFDEQQRKYNSSLVKSYAQEMWGAFQYWLTVSKWVSRQWLLGRRDADHKSDDPGVSFARIQNSDNDRPFWVADIQVRLLKRSEITADTWTSIQAALCHEAAPPTWITFLNEAAERLHVEDFTGCIASCAIASETAARAAYFVAAGSPTNPAVIDLMQRASVSAVIEKWKIITGENKTPPGASDVLKLAGVRNGLLHSGNARMIDRQMAAKLFEGTQKFVIHADDWYHRALNRINFGISLAVSDK